MTRSRSLRTLSSRRRAATPWSGLVIVVIVAALVTTACGTSKTARATSDTAVQIATEAATDTNPAAASSDDTASGSSTPLPQAGSTEGATGSAGAGAGSAESGESTDTSMADVEFTVVVQDGKVKGDTGRQEISVGDTVAVVVSADVTDHVHVHGYDLTAAVAPDEDAVIVFAADVPGVFEVELEDGRLPLTELLVR